MNRGTSQLKRGEIPRGRKPAKKGRTPQQQARADELAAYKVARVEYLEAHELCELRVSPYCLKWSTEISHIIGRGRGGPLADKRNFKAACHNCGQWVEHNKAKALELGFHKHAWEEIA